jgi:hypothetical protein
MAMIAIAYGPVTPQFLHQFDDPPTQCGLKPIIGAVRSLAEVLSAFAPDHRVPGKTIIRVTEDR